MKSGRVAVAMSGGVDSSLVCALLIERGYTVEGVTMRLWSEEPGTWDGAVESARQVAKYLDVPHRVVDLGDPFRRVVVTDFIASYTSGRTPNPCVLCNPTIKFGALWTALRGDFDYIATGHYVRTMWDEKRGRHLLLRGADPSKDQSYVLYGLDQEQLARSVFPLGCHTKDQVREMVRERNLPFIDRGESQEICFLHGEDYREFLKRHASGAIHPGPVFDTCGNRLGEHDGLPFYTVGQRRGIGISASEPLYVIEKNMEENALIVGSRQALQSRGAELCSVNWIPFSQLREPMPVTAQIRYNADAVKARLVPFGWDDGRAQLTFERPQLAVTPGQSAVCYVDDRVVGGGIIARSLSE